MATTQTQLRRGTNAQVNAMTPAEGEVVVDMTNDRLNVGDGIRSGGYPIPNFSDNQKNTFGYGVASGSADALTLALSPALLSYVEGVSIEFRSTTTNTGAATINVNGLGAISIRQQDLSIPTAGAITSGRNYKVTYNGTYFILMGSAPAADASGLIFLETKTIVSNQIAFTDLDGSVFSEYKLIFRGISTSAGNALRIQFSNNNGSSFLTSRYTNIPAGSSTGVDIASGPVGNKGEATIAGFGTNAVSATCDSNFTSAGSGSNRINTVGFYSSSNPVINAIRLAPTTGTMSNGSATLYGFAK